MFWLPEIIRTRTLLSAVFIRGHFQVGFPAGDVSKRWQVKPKISASLEAFLGKWETSLFTKQGRLKTQTPREAHSFNGCCLTVCTPSPPISISSWVTCAPLRALGAQVTAWPDTLPATACRHAHRRMHILTARLSTSGFQDSPPPPPHPPPSQMNVDPLAAGTGRLLVLMTGAFADSRVKIRSAFKVEAAIASEGVTQSIQQKLHVWVNGQRE